MKIPFSTYDFFGYLSAGFVVFAAVDYSFGQAWLTNPEPKLVSAIVLTFIAYVLGHAVAHLSWWLVEESFVRNVLRSPEETLFEDEQTTRWRYVFPGFYKPFPAETQTRVLEKAKNAGFQKPGRGLFFHCHPIAIRQQVTSERLSAFINMYGFARNVSFASAVAALLLTLGVVTDRMTNGPTVRNDAIYWAFGAASVAVIMLYRYLKFFRFYTAEVFRVYAET